MLIHPLIQDRIIRSVDGMGDEGEGIIGKAMGQGHGLAGIQEGFGADHRGRDTQLFHDDAVEHTARTAGASVPYAGNNGLNFGSQLFGRQVRNTV